VGREFFRLPDPGVLPDGLRLRLGWRAGVRHHAGHGGGTVWAGDFRQPWALLVRWNRTDLIFHRSRCRGACVASQWARSKWAGPSTRFSGSFRSDPPSWYRGLASVKNSEKPRDGVMVSQWTVVTAQNPTGALDFVVPTPDVPLVSAWLRGSAGTGNSVL
jgi:hypothetical protein